ncbi:sigma-54-dependent Fis family transcriptional regulator [Candidatus Fermentibacterales bacterium]|nr:sigma-54-dependent Fis family transcriptional regulator [Candidatus Fermentibacterales bacterium]
MSRVLIIDDDVAVTNYLMVFLMQTERFETIIVNDSREIPGMLEVPPCYDIMILDMDMPNVSGMDVLRMMHDKGIDVPVVVLTGVSDVDLAVKAMKLGAFDYLTKPVEDEHLLSVIDTALEHSALHISIDQLPSMLKREDLLYESAFEQLPTQDPGMIRLFHQAEKMADGDLCIFIWGERGTGKELLARAIHNSSPRRSGPFVAIDASAGEAEDFPGHVFGQEKSYNGSMEERPGFLEQAADGTLFLDDIEHLTLPMQVRLKRVIQTGEYYRDNSTRIRRIDVRFIVSSTKDLTSEEYNASFSRDLLYHLMVNSIRIPSLRERVNDIPLLAEYFLRRETERSGKGIAGFDPEFIELLKGYDFPDNVQELQTIIAGAVVKEEGELITIESLSPYIRKRIQPWLEPVEGEFRPRPLEEIRQEHIRKTLNYFGGDRDRAAAELGIDGSELDRALREDEEEASGEPRSDG